MTVLQQIYTKKYFYLLLFLLVIWGRAAQAQQVSNVQWGKNLLNNPGFENGGASWDIAENSARIVSNIAHSGKNSLYYSNVNSQKQEILSQSLSVQAGQLLYSSLWVKGKDIASTTQPVSRFPAPGIKIDVEFRDNQGQTISTITHSRTPGGSQGTYNWEQVRGQGIVPENAVTALVCIYLDKDIMGSVWIDDVETRVIQPDQITSFLLFPNYRGIVLKGDRQPWKFSLRNNNYAEGNPETIAVKNILTDVKGKVLFNQARNLAFTKGTVEFSLTPPVNLPLGNYQLNQTYTAPAGNVISREQYLIHVVPKMPKVYIDEKGFTVVDGKRFFPLGLYLNPADNEDLGRIAKGGFNTILSYHYGDIGKDADAYLARANQHDLKVIYSLKEMYPGLYKSPSDAFEQAAGYIKRFRNNPALLSWYINDELRLDWIPEINQMYKQVIQLDPNHPAFQMSNHVKEMEKYFNITDINGTDPYPVNVPYEVSPGLTSTYLDTRVTMDYSHDVKGVWIAPQIMDWATYYPGRAPHPPTLDEMRYQTYASIIGGAKGLIYYSYFDLWFADGERSPDKATFEKQWPNVVALAKEVKEIIPAVLEDKEVDLKIPSGNRIYASALEYQDKLLIILANPFYNQDSITFALPSGWKLVQQKQGEIEGTVSEGKITFQLPPVGSGVFRLEKNR